MKVSVLMSVYNEEEFLRECIESILGQTFEDFEFLIINDAATDGCRDIILSYQDPRIILVDNEKNLGLTASLNKGANLLKGEYVARIDADDVAFPDSLKKRVEFLEKNKDHVLVSGGYEVIDENGKKERTIINYAEDAIIREGFLGVNILASHTLYRRDVAGGIGFYDLRCQYAQDYDFALRMQEKGKIANIPEVLYKRRVHPKSISTQKGDERFVIDAMIRQNAIQRISEEERDRQPWPNLEGLACKDGSFKASEIFNDFGCHYIKRGFFRLANYTFPLQHPNEEG